MKPTWTPGSPPSEDGKYRAGNGGELAVGDFCLGFVLLNYLVLGPSGVVDSAAPRERMHRLICESNLKQIHLACDRDGNHDGYYNVIFVNGRLDHYRGATWYEAVRENHLRVPPARPNRSP